VIATTMPPGALSSRSNRVEKRSDSRRNAGSSVRRASSVRTFVAT
jgi:hypothetical protein